MLLSVQNILPGLKTRAPLRILSGGNPAEAGFGAHTRMGGRHGFDVNLISSRENKAGTALLCCKLD